MEGARSATMFGTARGRRLGEALAAFVLTISLLLGATPAYADPQPAPKRLLPRSGIGARPARPASKSAGAAAGSHGHGLEGAHAFTPTPTRLALPPGKSARRLIAARKLTAAADHQPIVHALPAPPTRLALPSAASSNLRSRPSSGYITPRLGGIPPRRGLDFADLPESDPPGRAAEPRLSHEADHVSGEKRVGYHDRVNRAVSPMPDATKAAIKSFTGSGYGAIRMSEESGHPNPTSDAIQHAFKVVRAEPGTVYRGLRGIDKATVQKWIQWDHKTDGPFRLGRGNVGATSSSAWDPSVAAQSFMGGHHNSGDTFKVLFKIQQRTGIPVETVSSVGVRESEVLLSRSAEFRVHNVSRWRGAHNVVLIELDEI